MATSVGKSQVRALYKLLLRESGRFPSYNFRMYALRKVRDEFRQNAGLKSDAEISRKYSEGLNNLQVIKRQVLIGQLYSADKLVIENIARN